MSERVARYQKAIMTMDLDAIEELRHPDYQCYYPQSGERFLTHQDWVDAHRGYADRFPQDVLEASEVKGGERKAEVTSLTTPTWILPTPVVSVSDTGDLVTMEGSGPWPDGKVYHWVRIIEYKDKLVWRETEYFAEPFDAPEWRAPFVTRDPA